MVSASPTTSPSTSHIKRRRGIPDGAVGEGGVGPRAPARSAGGSVARVQRAACAQIIARSRARLNARTGGGSSGRWSGPHCWAPLRTTRTPSGPTALAGPIAAVPNRSRISIDRSGCPMWSVGVVEQAQLSRRRHQVAGRDAQQAHSDRHVERAQRRPQRGDELGSRLRRIGHRHGTCDGAESGEAHLERRRACRRRLPSQPAGDGVGEAHQLALELVDLDEVARVGLLVADRLGVAAGSTGRSSRPTPAPSGERSVAARGRDAASARRGGPARRRCGSRAVRAARA